MSSRSLILSGFVRGCLSHTLIIRSPPEVRVRLRTLNSETPAADSLVSKIFSPAKQAQVGSPTQFYYVGFQQLDISVKSVFFPQNTLSMFASVLLFSVLGPLCLQGSAYRKPAFQPSAFRRLFIGFQPSAENQPPWKKFKYGINYMNW